MYKELTESSVQSVSFSYLPVLPPVPPVQDRNVIVELEPEVWKLDPLAGVCIEDVFGKISYS